MTTDFQNLLHTDPTCPFCGERPEDAMLTGLNCTVCQPCYETIHFWTPSYAKLFTDDGTVELWDYIPVAQTWRDSDCAHALFLDPQLPTKDLSEQTRKTIRAFTEGTHRELLERIPRNSIDMDLLPKRVQKPIIVTGDWVYAKDLDPVRQTSNTEEQTQATLTGAV